MPDLLIVAGPNGAGKTTFASEYLPAARKRFEYINADEIILSLPPAQRTDWRSARVMLQRLDDLVEAEQDFVFETTLATLTYARKIPLWRGQGYVVSLIYLRLPSVESSVARVRRRVAAGGHGIAEATIRRRFGKSARYFETIYKPIVDEWYIWDSLEGAFALRQSWDQK